LQGASPDVFVTEAGTPVTPPWFLRMIQRTGVAAKLPFPVHPHMLRHAPGYELANDGTTPDRWRTTSGTGACNQRRVHSLGTGSVQGFLEGLTFLLSS
jgi:integrase